ncbi:MAG: hypothetical protein VYA57_04315 [Candidatus Thermoplasmatota archaeon]|nr:hypothetical protein [Candidatus Thermoplasmatota archaeon]
MAWCVIIVPSSSKTVVDGSLSSLLGRNERHQTGWMLMLRSDPLMESGRLIVPWT